MGQFMLSKRWNKLSQILRAFFGRKQLLCHVSFPAVEKEKHKGDIKYSNKPYENHVFFENVREHIS